MSNGKTETAYLTTRTLFRVAKRAVTVASEDAMQRLGYIVKAEDGWVIRENQDGTKERLERIKHG